MYKTIRHNYLDLSLDDKTDAERCLSLMIDGAPDIADINHLREVCQNHLAQPGRGMYSEVEITIFAIFLSARWYTIGGYSFSDRTVNPTVYDVKVTLR